MKNAISRSISALALMAVLPVAALAQQHDRGNSGRTSGPASHSAPAAHTAPVIRAAPVTRTAPVARTAPLVRTAPQTVNASPVGFNLNRDIGNHPAPVRQPPVATLRTVTTQHPIVRGRVPVVSQQPPSRPPAVNFPHAPYNGTAGGPYHGRFTGPIVRNAHAPSGAWGWNHGVAWRSAPVYWGGGFWGPFAIASLTSAIVFGSIVDDQDQVVYPSYQVEPDSPGEQLLQDYGLQQTQCGPPGLVTVWGPDNSVICAFPNDAVPPGNYEVDPSTFDLVPASP
jgi:hypothetical protein